MQIQTCISTYAHTNANTHTHTLIHTNTHYIIHTHYINTYNIICKHIVVVKKPTSGKHLVSFDIAIW